jgi:archaetidylinositol phosphate synthase
MNKPDDRNGDSRRLVVDDRRSGDHRANPAGASPAGSSPAGVGASDHARDISGITATCERAALYWLAERTPPWVTPDFMTGLGLAGAIVTGVSLAISHHSTWWLLIAALGLIVNWVGDSMDGTLARYRRIERPRYGFYVDQIVDLCAQIVIMAGIGLSPYMSVEIAFLALAVYLAATCYTLLKLQISKVKQLTYYGVGPTEVRLLLIAGITLAAWLGPEASSRWLNDLSLFDLLALVFSLAGIIGLFSVIRRDALEASARQKNSDTPND